MNIWLFCDCKKQKHGKDKNLTVAFMIEIFFKESSMFYLFTYTLQKALVDVIWGSSVLN